MKNRFSKLWNHTSKRGKLGIVILGLLMLVAIVTVLDPATYSVEMRKERFEKQKDEAFKKTMDDVWRSRSSPSSGYNPDDAIKEFDPDDIASLFKSGVAWSIIAVVLIYFGNKKWIKAQVILANPIVSPSQQPVIETAAQVPPKLRLDDLEKMHDLRSKGIITEEEFEAKKKTILGL